MLVAAVGCSPVRPYEIRRDVIGPHGEGLIEIACVLPDECMAFARTVEKPVKIDAARRGVANRPAPFSGRNRWQTSAAELCSHLLWSIPAEQ